VKRTFYYASTSSALICALRFSLCHRGFVATTLRSRFSEKAAIRVYQWLLRTSRFLLLGSCIPSGFAADSCQQANEALQRRDLATAEGLLKLCLTASPAQLKPYLDLCGLYQAQGREEDVVRTASEGLKYFPEERRFYITVGNHAGRKAEYDRAIEVFSQAHQRWPDDAVFREGLSSAHLMLGMRLMDENRNSEAEPHLREAVRLSEKDVEAHLNLGRVLHTLNQSVEALAEFDRVAALDPKTPLVHFHRGLVLGALGELDEAIASLSLEIDATPDYPPSYLLRGEMRIKKGDWATALPDLDMAVKKMADNPKAVYTRGRCLHRLGRTKDAEADFRAALTLDPLNPEPMNALARLLWLTGRQEEATSLFKKAREMNEAARTVRPGEIQFESSAKQK
jgi:protein O-GlcNAc transferase